MTESATTGVQIGEEEMELAGPQSQWGNLEVQGAAEGKEGEISASEKGTQSRLASFRMRMEI